MNFYYFDKKSFNVLFFYIYYLYYLFFFRKINKMKKNISKHKNKVLSDEIPKIKSNLTIKKYINQRLKDLSKEIKNIKINNNNNINRKTTINPKSNYKNKNNLFHTNTSSSTTISEKSTLNKDISREINNINFNPFENEIYNEKEYNIRDTEQELEMIKEENEHLKYQLEKSQKKVHNLENILKSYLKENKPKNINNSPIPISCDFKYPPIVVKRKKRKRITKYTRGEDDDYFDDIDYYNNVCKTEGDL